MTSDERHRVVRSLQHALAPEDQARNPAYTALANRLATSSTAIDLLVEVDQSRRNPVLLLGICHYLALGGVAPFAEPFARVRDGDLAPEIFAAMVTDAVESHPDLVRAQSHRTTQTNEIGRSAVIGAVLRALRRTGVDEVDLIDAGCAAGLNLYPDQIGVGGAGPLDVVCDGPAWLFDGATPRIVNRVGVDREPIALRDLDGVRWLRACVWPEDHERQARLEAALAAAAEWPQPTLLRGSLPAVLDDALAHTDDSRTTVIVNSYVVAYLDPDEQRAYRELILTAAARLPIVWLSLEWPRAVPALALPEPTEPPPPHGAGAVQIVVTLPGGSPTHWGWTHSHGRWLVPSGSFGPKA